MNPDDEKWIDDNMDDPVKETGGTFKGIGFYSTDGKHTFSFEADTPEGRVSGDKWARTKYEQAMYSYGSKQANAAKEYKKVEAEPAKTVHVGNCQHLDQSIKVSSGAKNPKNAGRRYKVCNECKEFLGWA